MALPVFPSLPGLAFPVKRAAEWSTVKQDALSGKRTRAQNFSYPVWHWEVSFDVLRSSNVAVYAAFPELQELEALINSLMGGTGLFLYQDPSDHTATAQLFATGDGASKTYQLVRSLSAGGFTSYEPVFFPNVITDVQVNGVTTAVTLGNYGQVTFATAPNAGALLTWDGTYYWGCQFDDDQFEFENFMLGLWAMRSLKWSSLKLP